MKCGLFKRLRLWVTGIHIVCQYYMLQYIVMNKFIHVQVSAIFAAGMGKR